MYNYSIIIPHKNLPKLLERCLGSIPERDDVETIVVDDNSDPSVVDFEKFPGLQEKNVQIVFDKSGLGAGHARNVGLSRASGKWLVFSDCDDFFDREQFDRQLEAFKNENFDIVFFKINYMDSDSLKLARFEHRANSIFDLSKIKNDNNYIRFRRNAPWAKFIRRELVESNGVRFQETRWSNDAWFSTQVALLAKNVEYVDSRLYNYTYRENSLIKASSVEALKCRLDVAMKCEGTLIGEGFGKYRPKHIEYWFYLLLKKSFVAGFGKCLSVMKILGLKSFARGFASNLKNDIIGNK